MKRRAKPSGGGESVVAEINITPMVDILLCLLILQMVIQPGLQKGLDVQLPLPEQTAAGAVAPAPPAARDQIVLRVTAGPVYVLNEELVPAAELERTLRGVFRDRPRKVLFVDAGEDLPYEEVIRAVDVARGAGVTVVGLVPRRPVR